MIAYRVHTMLRVSHGRGRYDPPTRKRVVVESMIVYGYAFVLAALATWPIPGVPFKGGAYGGLACGPKSYDSEYIAYIRFGITACLYFFKCLKLSVVPINIRIQMHLHFSFGLHMCPCLCSYH